VDVALAQGSLTDGDEDVLVNASNTNAALGTGVSGAIAAACGGAAYQTYLFAELARQHGGAMEPGQVMVTKAGKHPRARWVAHVAVMDYRARFTARSFPTLDLIRASCTRLWDAIAALEDRPLSIAMVALGAGTGQLGVTGPTEAACATLAAEPRPAIGRVVFYGFDLVEYLAIARVVTQHFPAALETVPDELRAHLALRG
jgi:O-acetyl-ADP-ribose deacetylase (regulator of RNase III)